MNKKGEPWAIVEIADLDASTEVLCFSSTYANARSVLTEDAVLLVTANVSIRDGRTSLIAVDVTVPDLRDGTAHTDPITLAISVRECTRSNIEALREILQRHPGDSDVHIILSGSAETTRWATDPQFRVRKSPALLGDLEDLFGANCLTAPAVTADA